MVRCSVKYCTTDSRNREKISFFSFPQNISLRNIWIEVINRKGDENWIWGSSKRVCSLHFDQSFIIQHQSSKRRYLKDNSVPSLLLDEEQKTFQCSQNLSSSTQSATTNEEPSDLSVHQEDVTNPSAFLERLNKENIKGSKIRNIESASDSEETKIRKSIKIIHSYCTSPSILKNKVKKLKENAISHRKRMYKIKIQNRKLKAKVFSLTKIIDTLKKASLACSSCIRRNNRRRALSHFGNFKKSQKIKGNIQQS